MKKVSPAAKVIRPIPAVAKISGTSRDVNKVLWKSQRGLEGVYEFY
jgi:hypothetical protein